MNQKNTQGLLSNCRFLLKTAYRLNPVLFRVRIPLILLNAAAPFIPVVFLRLLLDEITVGRSGEKILQYVAALALITFGGNIVTGFLESRADIQMEITLKRMKKYLGECAMAMPYARAEQPRVRDFMLLAGEQADLPRIFHSVAAILTGLLTGAGMAAVIVTVQPLIFLLVLAVIGLRLLADRRSRKLWDKWRPRYAPIMRRIQYMMGLMKNSGWGKEVRLNHLKDWLNEKLEAVEHGYIKTCTGHNMSLQRNNVLPELAAMIQESVIYLLLAYKVVFSGMSIGDFSMYLTSIKTFADAARGIAGAFSQLLQCDLFAGEFRYCAEIAVAGRKEFPELSIPEGQPLTLEFRDVSFRYPQAEKMVLEHVSLTLREGESLSVVGLNGAGKTTFIKLLCRLYEPAEGEILLNGININRIPYEEYAARLGVVFQDFRLFAFSMEENITMGFSAGAKTVEECVEKSGLQGKLSSLSRGLQTNLSKEFDEKGIEFSGGEGQKLALARVLYKDAPVIILDEPTAALDPLAEYELYRRFHELVQGKCAVYISHRLSSTRFTDKIAVFDQGHVAEYGSHRELMSRQEGLYASMYRMQAQYYV